MLLHTVRTVCNGLVVKLVLRQSHLYSTAEGSDYIAPDSRTATFTDGSVKGAYVCFNFTIVDDDCVEYSERFRVYLASDDPDVIFHFSSAYVYIADNDCECALHRDHWSLVSFNLNEVIFLTQMHYSVFSLITIMSMKTMDQYISVRNSNEGAWSETLPSNIQLSMALL